MIQPAQLNTIESSTFDQSKAFTVQADAALFSVLTQKVYNNVVAAGIRELGTNAIDSCIMANLPIQFDVHLPTEAEPFFSTRDYGSGLSKSDLFGLFTVAGASTKRDSNQTNGTLGIGRLSPLAYTSSFTVESYYNGEAHSCIIAFDNGLPSAIDLGSSPTDQPNGLRITYPVAINDIKKFHSEAATIYKYFDHKPNLNVPLDIASPSGPIVFDTWFIDPSHSDYYAIMGNVRYKLDPNLVDTKHLYGLTLRIPIGSVTINPGRESLSYDQSTTNYLNSVIAEVYEDFEELFYAALDNSTSLLDKLQVINILCSRRIPYSLRRNLTLSNYPELSEVVLDHYAASYMVPTTFNVGYYSSYMRYPDYNNTKLNLDTILTTPVIIIDISTNYTAIYKQLKSQTILLKRQQSTPLPDFVAEAIQWCTNIGLSYTLASSMIDAALPTRSKSSSTPRPTGIYLSTTDYNGNFGRGNLWDQYESVYTYVPLNGTNVDLDSELYQVMYSIYKHYNRSFNNILPLVGVSKKYLKDIEGLDNFIPLQDYLKGILPLTTFISYSPLETNFDGIHKDLVAISPFCKRYTASSKSWNSLPSELKLNETLIPLWSKYFNIQHTRFTPDISSKQFTTRYPHFSASYNLAYRLHYVKLEDFYADRSCQITSADDSSSST